MDTPGIAKHILNLEEFLLHQDFTKCPEELESMLSLEFMEVNPDGVIISRKSVIQWLKNKDQAARWEFKEFNVKVLAPGLAQAIYHARQIAPVDKVSSDAFHNSIWKINSSGKSWELIFHQSVRVK